MKLLSNRLEKNLKNHLLEEQKRCKVRLLDLETIEQTLNYAEYLKNTLPKWIWQDLMIYHSEAIPNSYEWKANSSHLYASYSKRGKIKEIYIRRDYALQVPYGGRIRYLQVSDMTILNYVNQNLKRKTLNLITKPMGFNSYGRLYF